MASDDGDRVHNHAPYRPVCNERMTPGGLRGACLNDDGTDRAAPQQTAPDGGEGIVGALDAWADGLISALCDCGDFDGHPGDCAATPVIHALTTFAPTVARLIEDAVAERLAGVEALLTGAPMVTQADLRRALRGASGAVGGDLRAERASEAPGGRDEVPKALRGRDAATGLRTMLARLEGGDGHE